MHRTDGGPWTPTDPAAEWWMGPTGAFPTVDAPSPAADAVESSRPAKTRSTPAKAAKPAKATGRTARTTAASADKPAAKAPARRSRKTGEPELPPAYGGGDADDTQVVGARDATDHRDDTPGGTAPGTSESADPAADPAQESPAFAPAPSFSVFSAPAFESEIDHYDEPTDDVRGGTGSPTSPAISGSAATDPAATDPAAADPAATDPAAAERAATDPAAADPAAHGDPAADAATGVAASGVTAEPGAEADDERGLDDRTADERADDDERPEPRDVMVLPEHPRDRPTIVLPRGTVPGQPHRHDPVTTNSVPTTPTAGGPLHDGADADSRDTERIDVSRAGRGGAGQGGAGRSRTRNDRAGTDHTRADKTRADTIRAGNTRADRMRAPEPVRVGQGRPDEARLQAIEQSTFWLTGDETTHDGDVDTPDTLTAPPASRIGVARPDLPRKPRSPFVGLVLLLVAAFAATFFAWVSAEPIWLAVGHGQSGTATVTACSGAGIRARCEGTFTTGSRSTGRVALLGVDTAQRQAGATVPARMVHPDSRQAFVASSLMLHLRWSIGLLLVVLSGLAIAGATGARRLESPRARRRAVLLSMTGPLALLVGFLVASW
jgi:hypothetical protein